MEPSSPSYVTLFWLPYFLNDPFKLLTLHFVFGWKNKANIFLFKPVQLCELIVWVVTEGYVWKGTWTAVLPHSFPFVANSLCDKLSLPSSASHIVSFGLLPVTSWISESCLVSSMLEA